MKDIDANTLLKNYSYLTEEHFKAVLDDVLHQVFDGKGKERHGHDKALEEQPWKHITDNVGIGFVVGQSIKKLMELKTFSGQDKFPAWKREALGAIVYIVMAIMYKEFEYNE